MGPETFAIGDCLFDQRRSGASSAGVVNWAPVVGEHAVQVRGRGFRQDFWEFSKPLVVKINADFEVSSRMVDRSKLPKTAKPLLRIRWSDLPKVQ
ncbi:hypothetical protein [Rhizobium sophoriradicis]|uniref:hypothetical protein n=1 Tax=Rhizobium sophoriradicis TaxID=1535245 RepID=UPI001FDF08CE|nr:hypothetical protein [Rhizobium sophoriradicis]